MALSPPRRHAQYGQFNAGKGSMLATNPVIHCEGRPMQASHAGIGRFAEDHVTGSRLDTVSAERHRSVMAGERLVRIPFSNLRYISWSKLLQGYTPSIAARTRFLAAFLLLIAPSTTSRIAVGPNRSQSERQQLWRNTVEGIAIPAPIQCAEIRDAALSAVPVRLLIRQKTSLVSVDLNQGDFSMTGQFSALPWGANNQGDRR